MADNLYLDDPSAGGPLSGLGGLAVFAGVEYGHRWSTRTLIGRSTFNRIGKDHSWLGAMRARRRMAAEHGGKIWKAFAKPGLGFKFGQRFHEAEQVALKTVRSDIARGRLLSGLRHVPKESLLRSTGGITRFAQRTATKRAVAGILRAPLGAANAYFWIGSFLPDIAEAAVAGFGALSRFGAKLRRGTPETSVGIQALAPREQAFMRYQAHTMRQASEMAMHLSQLGTRSALGHEASYLHG